MPPGFVRRTTNPAALPGFIYQPRATVVVNSITVVDDALSSFSDSLTATKNISNNVSDSALGSSTGSGLDSNNAEGGSAGTTVTTGNSGGVSGNAWNNVAIGAGSTLTYDSTNQAHGTGLAYKVGLGASVTATYLEWTTSLGTLATNQHLAGRFYYVPGITTPSASIHLLQILDGVQPEVSIYHASGTGKLEIHQVGGTLAGTAGSLQLTIGTLYRIEYDFTGIGGGTTAGVGTVRVFLGDGTTAQGTDATASSVNFGSVAPDTLRIGLTTANSSPSINLYFDGIQVNTTGMPGPETSSGMSDSLLTTRQPAIADTGLSFSDSVAKTGQVTSTVSDTALALSESLTTIGIHTIADTAISFSDAVQKQVRKNVSDTSLSFSESLVTTRQRNVSDTALSFSDSPATIRVRTVSDAALSFSDSLTTTRQRITSDTALSFSDAVATTRQRVVSDTALAFGDAVTGTHGITRSITDSALTQPALYTDTFTRSVSAGSWGTADSGQTWSALGTTTASFFSVNGSTGLITPTTNTTNIVGIDAGGSFADGDIYMDMSDSLLPTTGNIGVGFRTQAVNPEQNYYRARIVLPAATGAPTIELAVVVANASTNLGSATAGFSIAAGDTWRMHVRAAGNRISVRAYPSGNTEPSTWDIDVLDPQWASGGMLIRQQIGSGGPKPVTSYDTLTATRAFDVPVVTKVLPRTISDTALSFSDSIASTRQHGISDTALSFSDAIASTRTRLLADTGLILSDAIATLRQRAVADTALSLSDSPATQRLRSVADTAVSVSDAVLRAVLRSVSDTAMSASDSIVSSSGGHVSDSFAFSDTLTRTVTRVIEEYVGTLLTDDFSATVSNGWGTDTQGDAWTFSGGIASNYAKASGVGNHVTTAAAVGRWTFLPPSASDWDQKVKFTIDSLPVGGAVQPGLGARRVDANNYVRLQMSVAPTTGLGSLNIIATVANVATSLTGSAFTATITPGIFYWLRFRIVGAHYQGKFWQDGTSEPGSWTYDVTDGAPLNTQGQAGPRTSTGAATTSTNTTSYDSYQGVPGIASWDTIASTRVRVTSDTALSFSDSIAKNATRSVSDSFTFSDSTLASKGPLRAVSDSFTFSDSVSRNATHTSPISETFAFSDSILSATARSRLLSDSFAFSDSISSNTTRSRPVSETFTFSDSVVATKTTTGTIFAPPILAQLI